ncbi:MAG: glutamyl-tRNA reductase [Planctomycetota bacterium]
MVELFCLSLNHRVTPLAVREGVAFSRDAGVSFLKAVREHCQVTEAMLLSTCNRTELYSTLSVPKEVDHARRSLDLLRDLRGFQVVESPRNYLVTGNQNAVRHLFRVAGGMESQILGEDQILGQVKEALTWARSAGTSGRVLHRLWEWALRVGKRVRTETAIGNGALSASHAALELARKVFGSLRQKQVLVIGSGEIARLLLESLRGVRVGGVTITNRTRAHADELAGDSSVKVRDFQELREALVEADLVVSSTGASEPIVRYPQMKEIRAARGGERPLLVVDLALPRDFEERCGQLDQVFLKNLDDLKEIVQRNLAEREGELPRAESIVEEECQGFFAWLHTLEVEPTIRIVRERFEEIRRRELEGLRDHLDSEAFAKVDRITRRMIQRLLHLPSENLKRHEALRDRELIAIFHELLTQEIPHPRAQRHAGDRESE